TSAAAPATRTSSGRSGRWRDDHADPGDDRTARRRADQARRGSEPDQGRREVPRRSQAARRRPRRDPALPVCARAHPRHRREPCGPVPDAEGAVEGGAPQIHASAAGTVVLDWTCGDAHEADRALADADVVVRQRLVNQRLIPTPMEPRGAAADYAPATGSYTV